MHGSETSAITRNASRPTDHHVNDHPRDAQFGGVVQQPIVSQFFTTAILPSPSPQVRSADRSRRRLQSRSDTMENAATQPGSDSSVGVLKTPLRTFSLGKVPPSEPRSPTFHHSGPHAVPSPHFPATSMSTQTAGWPGSPGQAAWRDAGDQVRRLDPRHPQLAPSPKALRPFHPQWEVERFDLPEMCRRLQTESAAGLAELFRSVLMRAWRGRAIVAVSSFGHGEGCTTVSLSIAHLAATFAARVAVVDGNPAKPSLGEALGISIPHDWTAAELQSIQEAAVGAAEDRMVIFPVNRCAATDSIGNDRPALTPFLTALREAFDLILVDAGPIFHAAHHWLQPGTPSLIDAAVIVRDVRQTSPLQLEDVCLRVQQAGTSDLSIVENFQVPTLMGA